MNEKMAVLPWARAGQSWLVAIALICGIGLLVHANSLGAVFLLDDVDAILKNTTIRDLGNPAQVMQPPSAGVAVQYRPVVNASLAVNYAVAGYHPWAYRLTNLALHLANAVVFYLLLRRLLPVPWGMLALLIAIGWLVHPFTTEPVAYTVQRTESMFTLATFLVLLGSVGAYQAQQGRLTHVIWTGGAIVAGLLGAGCKEAMAVVPLLVILLDRGWLYPSWRACWRERRGLYIGLGLIWVVLAMLMTTGSGTRGPSAGVGLGMSSLDYLQTQSVALWHYVRLLILPWPLIVDYGWPLVHDPRQWLPALLGWGVVAGLVYWLWQRYRPVALCLIAAGLVLAPSSSFIPLVTQTIAEKRMYLPSALVLLAVGLGLAKLWQYWAGRRRYRVLLILVVGGMVIMWATLTVWRYTTYHDPVTLWQDTVAKQPHQPRAWLNLGWAYWQRGDKAQARKCAMHAQAQLLTDIPALQTLYLPECDRLLTATK